MAEMLHHIVPIAVELGVDVRWLVMVPRADIAGRFFSLTGKLHKALHGGPTSPDLSSGDYAFFTAVGDAVAQDVIQGLAEEDAAGSRRVENLLDVFIVHDPQPAGAIARLSQRGLVTWRCHIGVADQTSVAAKEGWDFLSPALSAASAAVFSVRGYAPPVLASRSLVIPPGIAPLSAKNRDLSLPEIVAVLVRSGTICNPHDAILARCGAVDARFSSTTSIYGGSGRGWLGGDTSSPSSSPKGPVLEHQSTCELSGSDSDESEAPTTIERHVTHCLSGAAVNAGLLPKGINWAGWRGQVGACLPLLYRPCILQVSRFDNLKGFRELLNGFALLKSERKSWAAKGGSGDAAAAARCSRLICNSVLVLCGPDPAGVADDVGAAEELAALCAAYDALPEAVQTDVFITRLPMDDAEENALIVNALQRSAVVVVQNSLKEGFGLTVAEARYKRLPVVGSMADGIQSQCSHNIDAILVQVSVGRSLREGRGAPNDGRKAHHPTPRPLPPPPSLLYPRATIATPAPSRRLYFLRSATPTSEMRWPSTGRRGRFRRGSSTTRFRLGSISWLVSLARRIVKDTSQAP